MLLLLAGKGTKSQGFKWWADNVKWDSTSHWSTYIIAAPRHMGPNALPVPAVSRGRIDTTAYLQLDFARHSTAGDVTFNPLIRAAYVLRRDLIAFDCWVVPLEYFNTSHRIKTERKVYWQYYDTRRAAGDIYINTNVQVLNEEKRKISCALRMGFKLPSSSMQGAARYTDTPGFYFDLSAGKQLALAKGLTIHPYAMAGCFIWQTFDPAHFQDDAFLFGAGADVHWRRWLLSQNFSGYYGYLRNGDNPMNYKLILSRRLGRFSIIGQYWEGFQDNLYSSFLIGLKYDMPWLQGS